jgi:glycosyltransferase involved in cell wall biosynthesis
MKPKVCIVTDWITAMGGVARVDLALHEAFPEAPIYTSVYEPEDLGVMNQFAQLDIRTTWLQKLPRFLRRFHKLFPVLRVMAFKKLDLSDFDIIITSTSAESKHVRKTRPDQKIICYCHTPVRYYWSHQAEYRRDPGFGKLNFLVKMLIPLFLPRQKKLDYQAAQKVDLFIANSTAVQHRIKKYYGRDSIVIHPPVDIDRFHKTLGQKTRGGLLVVGRQVPYKRHDLAVKAASKLRADLNVYGHGPEHEKLVELAGPTVNFRVGASDQTIARAFGQASAFIFPADEDFGIVMVESLAAGCPVIAFNKGGARDIVTDGVTGILFDRQTLPCLIGAIKRAEATKWDRTTLRRHAKRFSSTLFVGKIRKVVNDNFGT